MPPFVRLMDDRAITTVFRILRRECRKLEEPYVTGISKERSPYRVLVACILSLRTKDETTAEASARLFARAGDPGSMVKLRAATLEKLIYPVGFYRVKARQIRELSRILLDTWDGRVPDSIDDLLTLPGVGRKTANLVVTLGYGKPGICVDIHVHRITNRWGYVKTKNPDRTEMALREKLPRRYWIPINDLLVTWGRHVCAPVSPRCSECPLEPHCDRVGVTRSR